MRINNKNTDDALDMFFAKARQEQSPVNNAEINKLLQGKKTSGIKLFFNQKTILMMSSVLLVISLLLYFINPEIKKFTNDKSDKSEKHVAVLKSNNENSGPANLDRSEIKLLNKISPENNASIYSETQKNASNSFSHFAEKRADLHVNNDLKTIQHKENNEDIKFITSTSTKLLELSEDVLNKMNITFTNEGICFGSKNDIFMCYNSQGTNLYISDNFDKEVVNKRISPVLITDAEGKHWRSTNFNEEMDKAFKSVYKDSSYDNNELYNKNLNDKYHFTYPDLQNNKNEVYYKHLKEFINKQVNSFIPVLVRLPEQYKNNEKPTGSDWGHDLILWFQPTDAFLSLLSDTIRTGIINENPALVNQNNKDEFKQNLKPANSAYNTEFSLYPNPVIDIATINYHLDKDKKVNIALHDISGKLIKVFVRNETRNAGNNSMEINLKDIIQGIYILSIETADGNILTQRVIKQ